MPGRIVWGTDDRLLPGRRRRCATATMALGTPTGWSSTGSVTALSSTFRRWRRSSCSASRRVSSAAAGSLAVDRGQPAPRAGRASRRRTPPRRRPRCVGEDELHRAAHLGRQVARSASLSPGRITRLSPARWAASTFSLIPPTGSTSPLSVISPVIADVVRDRPFAHERRERRHHRHARRRAVLRHRAGRHVDVDVVLVEQSSGRCRARRRATRT